MALESVDWEESIISGLNECSIVSLNRLGILPLFIRHSILANIAKAESLTEEEKVMAKQLFCEELGLSSDQAIDNYRRDQFLSLDDLGSRIELPLRLDKYTTRCFRAKAESRFILRKIFLDQVIYSLIRVPDQGLAIELCLRLREESASFSELACQYSGGHESSTRGIIGPCPLGEAHPTLVERLRTATIGEVSEVFQIEHWWIIFRLENFTPAIFDDKMLKKMMGELFDEHVAQLVSKIMQKLRDNHHHVHGQQKALVSGLDQ